MRWHFIISCCRGKRSRLRICVEKGCLTLCLGIVLAIRTASPELATDNDTKKVEAIERLCEQKLNEFRKRHRRSELEHDSGLLLVARHHSEDMLRRGYFSHQSPEGMSVSDRLAQFYPRLFGGPGENIFRMRGPVVHTSEEEIATSIINGWEKSAGHRANMLSPDFTHVAVGIAVGGDELFATCNFAEEIALLDEPLPREALHGDRIPVSGVVRGRVTLKELTAFLVIPDPTMKCPVPGDPTAYSVGGCFVKVLTTDKDKGRFMILLELDKGKGIYEFKLGQIKEGVDMFYPGWRIVVR